MLGGICIFLLATIPYCFSAPDPLQTLNVNLNIGEGNNKGHGSDYFGGYGYGNHGAPMSKEGDHCEQNEDCKGNIQDAVWVCKSKKCVSEMPCLADCDKCKQKEDCDSQGTGPWVCKNNKCERPGSGSDYFGGYGYGNYGPGAVAGVGTGVGAEIHWEQNSGAPMSREGDHCEQNEDCKGNIQDAVWVCKSKKCVSEMPCLADCDKCKQKEDCDSQGTGPWVCKNNKCERPGAPMSKEGDHCEQNEDCKGNIQDAVWVCKSKKCVSEMPCLADCDKCKQKEDCNRLGAGLWVCKNNKCERPDDKCVTDGGTITGAKCIFPFNYAGSKYNGCISTGHSQPWCSTMIDGNGVHVKNKWGNCASICKLHDKCGTEGGTVTGAKCIFPFIYAGYKYNGCISTGNSLPWCSTMVDGNGVHVKNKWGNCASICKLHECLGRTCGSFSCNRGRGICNGKGRCVSPIENPCTKHGCKGKLPGDTCTMGDILGTCDVKGECNT